MEGVPENLRVAKAAGSSPTRCFTSWSLDWRFRRGQYGMGMEMRLCKVICGPAWGAAVPGGRGDPGRAVREDLVFADGYSLQPRICFRFGDKRRRQF